MPSPPRTPAAQAIRWSARVALWTSLALTLAAALALDRWSQPIAPASFGKIHQEQGSFEGIDFLAFPEVRLLRDYIRIDTSDPHPDEARGAEFLAAQLGAAGIAAHVERFADGRANLWALVEGDDPKALVLHGHLDVEEATASRGWKFPPFSGTIEGPWIYGRGMYDMKSLTIAELLAMIDVKRSGLKPKRSLLLLQTSSEEAGSDTGTIWILAQHPELVARMGTVLTEGGVVEATNPSTIKYWGIEFGQKQVVRVGVCARDPAELERLGAYVSANGRGDPEPDVAPEVAAFLAAYGPSRDEARLRELLAEPDRIPRERDRFDALGPFLQALFRSEVQATQPARQDDGSYQMNLWVQIAPGSDPLEVTRRLLPPSRLRGFASEPPFVEGWGPASPLESDVFRGVVGTVRAAYPGVAVGPYFLPWAATDARLFRQAGIPSYGFSPFPVVVFDTVQIARPNERMQLPAFQAGVRLYERTVRRLVLEEEGG